jgi:hypothetical protein
MRSVGVGRRDRAASGSHHLRQAVGIVVVGVSEAVAGSVGVVPHLARQLVARVIPQADDRPVGVGPCADIGGSIVGVLVVGKRRSGAVLVLDLGRLALSNVVTTVLLSPFVCPVWRLAAS